jgi:hypothetical protein
MDLLQDIPRLRYNRHELPGRLAQWQRSWWCSKCGEIFEAG